MRESWEHHSLDSIDLLLRQIRAIQASIEVSRVTLETTGKTNVRCRMADARERGMKGLQNPCPICPMPLKTARNNWIQANRTAQKARQRTKGSRLTKLGSNTT
jgi:hypothetical protein